MTIEKRRYNPSIILGSAVNNIYIVIYYSNINLVY